MVTLPESAQAAQKITVRHLLSNSAGMPLGTIGKEYSPQSKMPSLRTYLSREAHLLQEPGSGFVYSNVGFNVLELLVEEVTERDFSEYMAKEVLGPLGMQNSSFRWQERLAPAIPSGYDLQGAPVPLYVYPGKGSGGLFAGVEDVARFVRAGMTSSYYKDHGVLGRESLRRLYASEVEISGLFGMVADSYGLGHFIEDLPEGRKAVWHGGQGHGWMTHFHSVPVAGEGIVILTNSQRSWPLMAQVLSHWARWSGIGSVNMSRISDAATVVRGIVGLAVLVSLWLIYRLVRGLNAGTRRWAPLSRTGWVRRLVQTAVGIGMLAIVGWSVVQPYLMVSSIFPATDGWVGASFCILAMAVILSVFFPFENLPSSHEASLADRAS